MKLNYELCDTCLHLLTTSHFYNSKTCHSCTKSKETK
jgi:hypothetical protein